MMMMRPWPSFFSLTALLITLFLCFIQGLSSQEEENFINGWCKTYAKNDTDLDINFCETSLKGAPGGQCAGTLDELRAISVRLIRDNVTDTRCHIKQLLKGTKNMDPFFKDCLEACFQLYSDAIPTLKDAMKYYHSKQYYDGNIQISAVMDAAVTCEDGFNEKEGVVSPLTRRNNDIFQLVELLFNVMETLHPTLND